MSEIGHLYLGDLGASKRILLNKQLEELSIVGTKSYMCPEMKKNFKNDVQKILGNPRKIDVFSLGLIFLEMIDRNGFKSRNPLNDDNGENLESYLRNIEERFPNEKHFFELIKAMLSFDPDKRLNLEDVYSKLEVDCLKVEKHYLFMNLSL